MPLLKEYNDYNTNPANETIDRVITRINNPDGVFYKILSDNVLVGAICVYWKEQPHFWISPMFILTDYQGEGIAQKAITLIEEFFPQATTWELRIILEEQRNCYLYEKMGCTQTGGKYILEGNATLVHYKKIC